MEGTLRDLHIAAFGERPIAAELLLADICWFLLNQQFVQIKVLVPIHGNIYRITKGTGQGLPHAGDLCDLLFWRAVERALISLPAIRSAYGVLEYFRFRDDMAILSSLPQDHPTICKFVKILQGKAKKLGYIIKEEEVGTSVPFLDTTVSIVDQTVVVEPFVKPNAIYNVPLCRSSGHAAHVHDSWPQAQIANKVKISRNPAHVAAVATQLSNRFTCNHLPVPPIFSRASLAPTSIINKFTKEPRVTLKIEQTSLSQDPDTSGRKRQKIPAAYWFVLPYHPAWERQIRTALKNLNDDPEVRSLHDELWGFQQPPLRAAWKNTSSHLESRIRTATADIILRTTESDQLLPRKAVGAAEAAVVVASPCGPTVPIIEDASVFSFLPRRDPGTPRKAIRHKFKW